MLMVSIALTGCNPGEQRPLSGLYRINVERIAETDNLVILRLHLVFTGERRVSLYEEHGSNKTATISSDSDTGLAECEVLIVADVVNSSSASFVKCLYQIQGKGVTAGGPTTHRVDAGQTLPELLHVHIKTGEYDLDSELDIVTFRGQRLRMKIRK